MNRILQFTKFFFKIFSDIYIFQFINLWFCNILFIFNHLNSFCFVRKCGFYISNSSNKSESILCLASGLCPNDINLSRDNSQDRSLYSTLTSSFFSTSMTHPVEATLLSVIFNLKCKIQYLYSDHFNKITFVILLAICLYHSKLSVH